MTTNTIYRVPGQPSRKTLNFLKKLKEKGCPDRVLNQLQVDLFCFEMASINSDYDEAVLVFADPPKEYVTNFLKELNPFIKALSSALRLAELQRKAVSNDKDSIEAQKILAGITDDVNVNLSSTAQLDEISKRYPL